MKALCFRADRQPRSSFRSSGQILLPRYLMKGLSNLDETYRDHLLAPSGDLIRFLRSKVNDILGHSKDSHVDAGALKSIL